VSPATGGLLLPAHADDPSIDVERARGLVAAAFPELALTEVQRLGRGWDHDVFLIDRVWAFRFPRNAAAARAMALELGLLPWLALRLPCAIPEPRWAAGFEATLGWKFAGHRCIPGATLCDIQLDEAGRSRLAPALGTFCRALHAVPLTGLPAMLPPDPLGRFDFERRGPATRERLTGWRREGALPGDVVTRLLRGFEECPARPAGEGVVIAHTDLHTRNILVDSAGELTGVIDWVDVHAGERAADLATLFMTLPPGARDSFLAQYGSVDPATLARARWRAIDHTTRAFAGATERGDEAFARASRRALIEMSIGAAG
jgi:aminoglycoside phosphotransferase (APT) family kinase protein